MLEGLFGKEEERGSIHSTQGSMLPPAPPPSALPLYPRPSLQQLLSDAALSQHTPLQSHLPGLPCTALTSSPLVPRCPEGHIPVCTSTSAHPRCILKRRLVTVTPAHNSAHTSTHIHTVRGTQIHKRSQAPALVGEGGTCGYCQEEGTGMWGVCVVCTCVCVRVPVYEYWILL